MDTGGMKIHQHQYFRNYLVYCAIYSLLGFFLGVFGPIVPYWSESQGRALTDYTILVTVRTIFYIVGTLSTKILTGRFTIHQLLLFGLFSFSVATLVFDQTQNMLIRCICYSISAFSFALFQVYTNMAILEIFKGEHLYMGLIMLHGWLGIGFLASPIFVGIFKLYTHSIFGLIALILLPILKSLKCPQKDLEEENDDHQEKLKQMTKLSLVLACLCYFFEVGISMSYGSWISSYILIRQIGTKELGLLFCTIFWMAITGFRMVFSFFPNNSSSKIRIMTICGAFVPFIGLFLIYNVQHSLGLLFCSLSIGLCDSALFGLLQTQLHQNGYKANQSQLSTIFIFVGLGDGAIVNLVQILCSYFGWQMLFGWISISFIIVLICTQLQVKQMQSGLYKPKNLNEIELKQRLKD